MIVMTSKIMKTVRVRKVSSFKVPRKVERVRNQGVRNDPSEKSYSDKRRSLHARDMAIDTLVSVYLLRRFVSIINNQDILLESILQ